MVSDELEWVHHGGCYFMPVPEMGLR